MTSSRADYLEALAEKTPGDIADLMDAASTPDDYWTALHAALLKPGYVDMLQLPADRPIFARVSAARVRCGLTTSEAARTLAAQEAEQRVMNERAARRAG